MLITLLILLKNFLAFLKVLFITINDPIINSYKLNIKYDNKLITPSIE